MEELTQDGAQLARTMLMSAAQLAESMARVQAQRAWMAQSRATAQAAQAQQQIAAEQDAARMIFRPLTDDRYWQNAPQLDRVVQAYMTAASWAEHDPEARAAVQLIKQHAEGRWSHAVGDAMHVSDAAGVDHDHDLGDAPMTVRQRRFLGVEFGVDLTKAEASQAIKERLQINSNDDISRESPDSSRHDAQVAETVIVEGIARQADAELDHLGDLIMSSGDAAADVESQVARRQSEPAIAQPIQQSLLAARRSQGKLPGGGPVAAARFTKVPEGQNGIRSGWRDRRRPGLPPGLG